MAEELPILYRDEFIVVIDKPPNLLVHRSQIDRHETRFAVQILRDQIGQRVWPAHRLDRGTSGILLFGLSPEIASALGRQFENGMVENAIWLSSAATRRSKAASITRSAASAILMNSGMSEAAWNPSRH